MTTAPRSNVYINLTDRVEAAIATLSARMATAGEKIKAFLAKQEEICGEACRIELASGVHATSDGWNRLLSKDTENAITGIIGGGVVNA